MSTPIPWDGARTAAYEAGRAAALPAVDLPLADTDGATLAEPLVTLTDLPAFPTSSVDGFAVRGAGPWPVVGRVLAGNEPGPLADGTAVEIATGAMVPTGTEQIIRVEDSKRLEDGTIDGTARPNPDWRRPGEEATAGEELLPAGTAVTPAVTGLAAACGYDTLGVRRPAATALLVFGDELATSGTPSAGRIRDSLGPSLPAWLGRAGGRPVHLAGPIEDTLDAHVAAIRAALDVADVVCTTGGTMHGPVDHLHPALAELGAEYVVNTVAVRPGFPMLIAQIGPKFLVGLPGNPQSAVVALVTLAAPLLAGLAGRPMPTPSRVTLGTPIPGRGDFTHLALARLSHDDAGAPLAKPLAHVGSSMLRGVAGADGFVVIPPGEQGKPGDRTDFVPLPLWVGER